MIHIATMLPDAYGCVVANRFGELLDDDAAEFADPFDLINEAESVKEKKKEELKSNAAARQKKPAQRETRGRRVVPVNKPSQESLAGRKQQPRAGVVNNLTGYAAVEPQGVMSRPVLRELSRRPGFREPNQEDLPKEYSIAKPSYDADYDRRGRGGSRAGRGGGGRGAYPRNTEDFNLRGKREFERHSGTGKSPEDKRGGRGPYNWGSVGDTAGELMEVTAEATAKPEDPQPTDFQPPPEEERIVYKSLEEWKAEQEMSRPKVELNLRKADSKVPSKATVIHQSKHVENKESLEYIEEEEEEGYYVRRVNDITSRLDINFGSLKRPTRGRGRETKEKPASPTEQPGTRPLRFQNEVAPNPDDPEDFPALTAGR